MKKVETKNTGSELALRSLLHAVGYRFRLHRRDLPGTPDIVLPRYRVALFVHGCLAWAQLQIWQLPKSNLEYWRPKISANSTRDLKKGKAVASGRLAGDRGVAMRTSRANYTYTPPEVGASPRS